MTDLLLPESVAYHEAGMSSSRRKILLNDATAARTHPDAFQAVSDACLARSLLHHQDENRAVVQFAQPGSE